MDHVEVLKFCDLLHDSATTLQLFHLIVQASLPWEINIGKLKSVNYLYLGLKQGSCIHNQRPFVNNKRFSDVHIVSCLVSLDLWVFFSVPRNFQQIYRFAIVNV